MGAAQGLKAPNPAAALKSRIHKFLIWCVGRYNTAAPYPPACGGSKSPISRGAIRNQSGPHPKPLRAFDVKRVGAPFDPQGGGELQARPLPTPAHPGESRDPGMSRTEARLRTLERRISRTKTYRLYTTIFLDPGFRRGDRLRIWPPPRLAHILNSMSNNTSESVQSRSRRSLSCDFSVNGTRPGGPMRSPSPVGPKKSPAFTSASRAA